MRFTQVLSAAEKTPMSETTPFRVRDCAAPGVARAGVLRRIFTCLLNALMESQQRQAERDMERLLMRSGGRLTDDIERRATQQHTSGENDRFI